MRMQAPSLYHPVNQIRPKPTGSFTASLQVSDFAAPQSLECLDILLLEELVILVFVMFLKRRIDNMISRLRKSSSD